MTTPTDELHAVSPSAPRRPLTTIGAIVPRIRRSGIVIPFVVLFVVLAARSAPFATKVNLLNILDQQSATLIIACAGTLVLIGGGLDLSVGATYALSAVIATRLAQHEPALVAVAAGLAIGLLIGLVNGIVVAVFEINALISTLAMSFLVSGVASLYTNGNAITAYNRQGYGKLAQSSFLTLTSATWIMIGVVVVLGALLWASTFGRYVYGVGGNSNAARLAGVRVTGIRIATFALSGVAASLGGLIDSSRVLSAQSSDGGDTLTFTVIAGIVVGGTSIMGGEGAVWRSVIGVLFLALIGNGYNLLGLNPLYQQVTLGALILLSVGAERVGPTVQRWRRSWSGRHPSGSAAVDA